MIYMKIIGYKNIPTLYFTTLSTFHPTSDIPPQQPLPCHTVSPSLFHSYILPNCILSSDSSSLIYGDPQSPMIYSTGTELLKMYK